ncbi:MAG: cytochrome c [Gammaproteobacteria bacterium]|nr:cytochrome c [Gammaproteobacteria bacterium]
MTACSLPDRKESRLKVVVPPIDFVADEQKGELLYSEYCSACHGPKADGTRQGPPLAHHIYKPNHHSDMHFYKAVQFGTYQHHWRFGNMPPVKGISPPQTGHIIKFIRAKQSTIGLGTAKEH